MTTAIPFSNVDGRAVFHPSALHLVVDRRVSPYQHRRTDFRGRVRGRRILLIARKPWLPYAKRPSFAECPRLELATFRPWALFLGLHRKCDAVAMRIDLAFDYFAVAKHRRGLASDEMDAVIAVLSGVLRNVLILHGRFCEFNIGTHVLVPAMETSSMAASAPMPVLIRSRRETWSRCLLSIWFHLEYSLAQEQS